jgi:hypothetical protein
VTTSCHGDDHFLCREKCSQIVGCQTASEEYLWGQFNKWSKGEGETRRCGSGEGLRVNNYPPFPLPIRTVMLHAAYSAVWTVAPVTSTTSCFFRYFIVATPEKARARPNMKCFSLSSVTFNIISPFYVDERALLSTSTSFISPSARTRDARRSNMERFDRCSLIFEQMGVQQNSGAELQILSLQSMFNVSWESPSSFDSLKQKLLRYDNSSGNYHLLHILIVMADSKLS